MAATSFVIGIDGGGSKTLAWLVPIGPEIESTKRIGRGLSGPSNPRAVGIEHACLHLQEAIEQAFQSLEEKPREVDAICFCLAGAGREEEQALINRWALENRIARRVNTTGDADPILAAASDTSVGVALISGTGSLAWGRNAQGRVARCGGWGYLFGDEGSGYTIALEGLRAAAMAVDGRGPATLLREGFLKALDAKHPNEWIEKVYGSKLDRTQIAQLSQVVFDSEEQQDREAIKIIEASAFELCRMVCQTAKSLELPSRHYPLAVAGGLLVHQISLRQRVEQNLRASPHPPEKLVVVEEPVQGAVELAKRLLVS